jgi:hypothetical protein
MRTGAEIRLALVVARQLGNLDYQKALEMVLDEEAGCRESGPGLLGQPMPSGKAGEDEAPYVGTSIRASGDGEALQRIQRRVIDEQRIKIEQLEHMVAEQAEGLRRKNGMWTEADIRYLLDEAKQAASVWRRYRHAGNRVEGLEDEAAVAESTRKAKVGEI